MDVEVLEIRQHMGRFPPFEELSDELLDAVADSVDVSYYKAGSMIMELHQPVHELHFIRSGAVEIYRRSGTLYNRLEEGDIYGHFSLLRNHQAHFSAKAIEDTLIYLIPASIFEELCAEDEQFADFVELDQPRLKSTVERRAGEASMMTTRVRKLITRLPVVVDASVTVQEAARRISEEHATAVLVLSEADGNPRYNVTDDTGKLRQLLGIITDSDFRSR